MSQAQPPDNEGDWESIDIFLFSNGQQYSPPRKYHLRFNELNKWDATLNHLAKSQFGNLNSAIQLYTLEGQRVEGPLELRNGMAYVAVEPPDAFMDTGYDKYLIKATRSWEKRQARKSSSFEMTPDTGPIMGEVYLKTDTEGYEITSIKPPEENLTLESVINLIEKPPDTTKVQEEIVKSAPTTKQVEKRRTSFTQRLTTFRKAVNPTVTPPIRKFGPKADGPTKKLTKLPIRTPTPPPLSAKSRIYAKTALKAKETPAGTIKNYDIKVVKSRSLTKVPSNNKSLLTDSTPMENVIGDKEIILVTNLLKNPESDIKSVKVDGKEEVGVQYVPDIVTNDEEIQSIVQTIEIPVQKVAPKKNVNGSNNPIDDNYIPFMNKGDFVNLRLLIEIRNVDNRSIKCTNIFKKESQNNAEDEILIQTESFQSDNEISKSGDKVVLVRCRCRESDAENDASRNNTSSVHTNNKIYYVLLPQCEETETCRCDPEVKSNKSVLRPRDSDHRESSIINPLKPAYSDMSLQRLTNTRDRDSTSRDIQVPDSQQSILVTAEYGTNTKYNPSAEYGVDTEYTNGINGSEVVRQKVVIAEDQLDPSIITRQRSMSERVSYSLKSSVQEPKVFVDNCTQTNSSDILLEARQHDDGRYTFHLPSLLMLKHYKL